MIESHLRTLGLKGNPSWDQIISKYRSLLKKWHPDLYGSSPTEKRIASFRTQQMNEAMEGLRKLNYQPKDMSKLNDLKHAVKTHASFKTRVGLANKVTTMSDSSKKTASAWNIGRTLRSTISVTKMKERNKNSEIKHFNPSSSVSFKYLRTQMSPNKNKR